MFHMMLYTYVIFWVWFGNTIKLSVFFFVVFVLFFLALRVQIKYRINLLYMHTLLTQNL